MDIMAKKNTVFFIFFPLGVFGHNREEAGVARIAVPQKNKKQTGF